MSQLGNMIIAGVTGQTAAPVLHLQFMKAVGDYITAQVTLNVTFSGTNPTSGASITTKGVMKINGAPTSAFQTQCVDPAGGDGMAQWLAWLQMIYSGIALAIVLPNSIVPTGAVMAFPLMKVPTFSRDELKSAFGDGSQADPQGDVIRKLGDLICEDMKKFYIPAFPAIMGAFVGACTVDSVTTP